MKFLAIIVFVGFLFVLVREAVKISVYGWFIPEKELDAYFGKYLDLMEMNQFSSDYTLLGNIPRFVSRSSPSMLSAWYIDDVGTIPRWSKWHRILDEKRAALIPKHAKKRLSEL